MPRRRRPKTDIAKFASLAAICCGLLLAQESFEVASVKPTPPSPDGRILIMMQGGPGTDDPGQIHYSGVTLRNILISAYAVKTYQITGPAWMDSERYDIVAKVPAGASKAQFQRMMQALLMERFKITLHRESKEMSGYELVVAKGGVKMKEVAVDPDAPPDGPAFAPGERPQPDKNGFLQLTRPGMVSMLKLNNGNLEMSSTAKEQPISKIAEFLDNSLGGPVVDKTGLTGHYDYTLQFSMDARAMPGLPLPPPPPGASAPADTPTGPTLQAAIQEQLGLRVEQKKVAVEMLVIDRADKTPTEN